MKRLILTGLVTVGMLVAPTAAKDPSGYTGCSTGAGAYTYTRGGYEVAFSRYQGRGMACSSVRYVINKWLRPKVARQYSWPRSLLRSTTAGCAGAAGSWAASPCSATSSRRTRRSASPPRVY